jgi:hypothetical protein
MGSALSTGMELHIGLPAYRPVLHVPLDDLAGDRAHLDLESMTACINDIEPTSRIAVAFDLILDLM